MKWVLVLNICHGFCNPIPDHPTYTVMSFPSEDACKKAGNAIALDVRNSGAKFSCDEGEWSSDLPILADENRDALNFQMRLTEARPDKQREMERSLVRGMIDELTKQGD